MPLEILFLIALSAIAQAQWSYRLDYHPITRSYASWATVPANAIPKPCAGLSRRYTHRNRRNPGPASEDSERRHLAGVLIHQPTSTDNNNNPKMVSYLGFWANYDCRNLPKFVVHFIQELGTQQAVSFQQLETFIPGFRASEYNIWGWGEIPQGDVIFRNVPPGGVAFRESGLHSWTGNYIVVENMVGVGPQTLLNGAAAGNVGTRPTHWHIDIGDKNQVTTRPKNSVYQPLRGEITNYRYYGPARPGNVGFYQGRDHPNRAQDARNIEEEKEGDGETQMEEEPELPPAYNMDENKKAILRAYVAIHGAESTLYAFQQMIDGHRYQKYLNLLTPELQEAARRDGVMQRPLGERADILAERYIQRETLRRRVNERPAFLERKRAELQEEKSVGRNMVAFLVNELKDIMRNEIGNENRNLNNDIRQNGEGDRSIEYLMRAESQGQQNNGMEIYGDEVQEENEIEAEDQEFQEPTSHQLGFQPTINCANPGTAEISGSRHSIFGTFDDPGLYFGTASQDKPHRDDRSSVEEPLVKSEYIIKSEYDYRDYPAKVEEGIKQEDGYLHPDFVRAIDSQVEELVKSEYDELLWSEGLDNNPGSQQDSDELSPLDTMLEETEEQIGGEFPHRLRNEASDQLRNDFLVKEEEKEEEEEILVKQEEEGRDNNLEDNDVISSPRRNPNNQALEALNQEFEAEPNEAAKFATSWGRSGYQGEDQPDNSPRPGSQRRTTSYGRMSFSDWVASQSDQARQTNENNEINRNSDQSGDEREEMIEEPG